jgi:hypothetical protein
MAVELEKIAELLEEAYENISSLEHKVEELSVMNSELEHKVELSKEASAQNSWDSFDDMGSAVDYSSPEAASPESRLDEFLNG